jgi:hypothetical protein
VAVARETGEGRRVALNAFRAAGVVILPQRRALVLRKVRQQMREPKYYVATAVDGFLGHEDGSVDGFVAEGEHATEFSEGVEPTALESIDAKTYHNGVVLLRYRTRL